MYAPLVVPEILMGISLLMAFVAVGVPLGLLTIFLAHVTFCLSYVALTVPGQTMPAYRVPFAGFKGDYQSIPVLVPTANGFPNFPGT